MATAPIKKPKPVLTSTPVLALDGGPRVREAPLPPWPHFAIDEIDAVKAVLRSGKVNYWRCDGPTSISLAGSSGWSRTLFAGPSRHPRTINGGAWT